MSVLEMIIRILLILVVIGPLIALLIYFMFISIIYTLGYIYDSIFGDLLIKFGRFIGRKFPKIKDIPMAVKLWMKLQPKELYLRYETPLCTYCFSYTAISLLTLVMHNENLISTIVASLLYLLFYFVGMARRCGSSEQYYKKILDNNIEFLKLSFLPLGFIITVLGFCFTVTGLKVQELPFDFIILKDIWTFVTSYNDEINMLIYFLKLIVLEIIILMIFYIISIPIQVISYYIICIINYFRKYKVAYIELIKTYFRICNN